MICNVQDKIFFIIFDVGSHPPLSRHCLEIMLHLGGEGVGGGGGVSAEPYRVKLMMMG